eukprot:6207413-Pleurochrysis_carterae.AAC.3
MPRLTCNNGDTSSVSLLYARPNCALPSRRQPNRQAPKFNVRWKAWATLWRKRHRRNRVAKRGITSILTDADVLAVTSSVLTIEYCDTFTLGRRMLLCRGSDRLCPLMFGMLLTSAALSRTRPLPQ